MSYGQSFSRHGVSQQESVYSAIFKNPTAGPVSSVPCMFLQMVMRCLKRARLPIMFSQCGCVCPQNKAENWYFFYLDSEFVKYLMKDYGWQL